MTVVIAPASQLSKTIDDVHLRCTLSKWLTHIPSGTGFRTCVDWDPFAHFSDYFAPLKPVTLSLTSCISNIVLSRALWISRKTKRLSVLCDLLLATVEQLSDFDSKYIGGHVYTSMSLSISMWHSTKAEAVGHIPFWWVLLGYNDI
jgi:hypothetical protein